MYNILFTVRIPFIPCVRLMLSPEVGNQLLNQSKSYFSSGFVQVATRNLKKNGGVSTSDHVAHGDERKFRMISGRLIDQIEIAG